MVRDADLSSRATVAYMTQRTRTGGRLRRTLLPLTIAVGASLVLSGCSTVDLAKEKLGMVEVPTVAESALRTGLLELTDLPEGFTKDAEDPSDTSTDVASADYDRILSECLDGKAPSWFLEAERSSVEGDSFSTSDESGGVVVGSSVEATADAATELRVVDEHLQCFADAMRPYFNLFASEADGALSAIDVDTFASPSFGSDERAFVITTSITAEGNSIPVEILVMIGARDNIVVSHITMAFNYNITQEWVDTMAPVLSTKLSEATLAAEGK